MPIKSFRPTTPTRRFQTLPDSRRNHQGSPEKSLVEGKKRTGGRTLQAQSRAASAVAEHKKAYRIIDFKRDKAGIPAKVAAIEYDPNRSARIALLHYADGEKRYIICAGRARSRAHGDSGAEADIWSAMRCRCKNIRPAQRFTTSNCVLARAARWPVRPVRRRSWFRKKATSRC